MSASTSLYRKYRSQTFDELVGQEPVVRTLKNAITSGRISHAYLFTGPRGVGKTSAARLLARAANCLSDGQDKPCNQCANCTAANRDIATDLIEIDAASNTGVDNIREVIERANFAPSVWKTKFYVIDECFRYDDLVTLADGSKMPIGRIVNSRWQGQVLSYNPVTQQTEPKSILRHMRKVPSLPMVRVTFDNNRAIVCTFNHKIYTPQGQKHASDLEVGQFVYANYERLTRHQLETVMGAALGDGHVSMTGSGMRARLSISQGVAQKDYLEYKKQLLGPLVATDLKYQFSPESYSRKGTYRLATLSCPQIAQVRRQLYDSAGRKHISRDYLDQVGPLGLALWYLDDGSLVTGHSYYKRKKDNTIADYPSTRSTFSTYGFALSDVQVIKQWLQENWGISGGISATAKGPMIWLTLEGTARLHQIIAPFVPPSMEYKLLPPYRDQFDHPKDENHLAGLAVSVVKGIEWVEPTNYVYNIEVADNHNYFVRDILVANCHMLTVSAFNALLKTLEEPPPHTAFILATTEVHKVPATVASRCQRFDFRRVPLDAMVARLEHICELEEIPAERAALELVARHATGSLRDAESLLDQLRVFAEGAITLESVQSLLGTSGSKEVAEFVDSLIAADLASGLRHVNRVLDEGLDLRQFNRQIVEYLRGLMLVKTGAASGDSAMLDVTEEVKGQMRLQVERVTVPDLLRWIAAFAEADAALRSTSYRQLPLEMALVTAVLKPGETGGTVATTSVRDRGPEVSRPTEQVAVPAAVSPSPIPTEKSGPPQRALGNRDAHREASTKPPLPESEAAPPPIHAEMRLPEPLEPEHVSDSHVEAEVESISMAETIPANGAAGGDELDRLTSLWETVVDQINARSKNVASVFRDPNLVRPHGVAGNVVTLSFRYPIQADRCRKEPWRGVIEQSFSRVLGYPVRVDSILFDEGSGRSPGAEGSRTGPTGNGGNGAASVKDVQSPYESSRGRAAMNIFGIDKFEDPQQ
jgi:DNA polymerase-3 subunit gamma/tau